MNELKVLLFKALAGFVAVAKSLNKEFVNRMTVL